MVKPEDPVVKPEDPVKTEPTEGDIPMEDIPLPGTTPVVVQPRMPAILNRLSVLKLSSQYLDRGKLNTKEYYNINGEMIEGPEPNGTEQLLFNNICPDSYSRKYAYRKDALALSSGTGLFGHYRKLPAASGDGEWWSTRFKREFTVEDYGQYFTKLGSKVGSDMVLMGACMRYVNNVYEDQDGVWLKWGAVYGVVAHTPTMQFMGQNERGADALFNYSIPIVYNAGEVDVERTEIAIMEACPMNGCFFTMDLRTKLIYFSMMEGSKYTEKGIFPRDWVPDTDPKVHDEDDDDDVDDDSEEEEEEPEPTPAPTPAPTTKLTSLPQFYTVQGINDGAYGGALFNVNLSRADLDRTHTWLPSFTGYDAASIEGPGQLVPTLAESQHATGVDVGQLLGYSGGYISFAALYAYQVQGQFIQWYSGWLAAASSSEMCGWLLRQSDGRAGFVFTSYGYTSRAPTANRSGQTTYTLTSANVQNELISQMMIPGQSAAGRPSCLGFAYDARIGDYGQVTWLSQI